MKSISSQLNRGTELLKQTVHRAIFSAKVPATTPGQPADPPTTAKPTPYHSDPHAVTRSCSVDSLHLETCHIRPIRPYSLTPFRRTTSVDWPRAIKPTTTTAKFKSLKVTPRVKLQLGGSAFCSLAGHTTVCEEKGVRKGAKRKRSVPEEEEGEEEKIAAPKRGKRGNAKKGTKKATTAAASKKAAAAAKRKSIEQEKQEREDFELAKRLQKELDSSNETNASNGTNSTTVSTRRRTRNGRSSNSVATSYSLRTTRSLSKFSLSSGIGEEGEECEVGVVVEVADQKQGKKLPASENGLTTTTRKNKSITRSRKASEGVKKAAISKEGDAPPPPLNNNNNNKRRTRSKGSCRSTK